MTPSVKLLGYTRPLTEKIAVSQTGDDGREVVAELDFPTNVGLYEPLDLIEYSGRWDYGPKSVAKMGDRDIIRRWIQAGEESMLEMVDVVFQITCSRVVSHELVRHRIASYQQESQRYVKYDEEDPYDLFYIPDEVIGAGDEAVLAFQRATAEALRTYKELKAMGVKSQIARYVLPNATRTRMVVKMNLRQWRHFLKLRMHKSAQPEMQDIANQCFEHLNNLFPEVFADIPQFLEDGERAAR